MGVKELKWETSVPRQDHPFVTANRHPPPTSISSSVKAQEVQSRGGQG